MGEVATVNRYEGTSGAARQQNLNRPQLLWNESSTDPQFAPEQNVHAHGKQHGRRECACAFCASQQGEDVRQRSQSPEPLGGYRAKTQPKNMRRPCSCKFAQLVMPYVSEALWVERTGLTVVQKKEKPKWRMTTNKRNSTRAKKNQAETR